MQFNEICVQPVYHRIAGHPPAIANSHPFAPLQRAVILALNAVKGKDPQLFSGFKYGRASHLPTTRPRLGEALYFRAQ